MCLKSRIYNTIFLIKYKAIVSLGSGRRGRRPLQTRNFAITTHHSHEKGANPKTCSFDKLFFAFSAQTAENRNRDRHSAEAEGNGVKRIVACIWGIEINMDSIDMNDKETYEMISRGDTDGVFQLESAGMKSFMKELKPQSLEDIIAGISLYRPGPMDIIPSFIKRKFNHLNKNCRHTTCLQFFIPL